MRKKITNLQAGVKKNMYERITDFNHHSDPNKFNYFQTYFICKPKGFFLLKPKERQYSFFFIPSVPKCLCVLNSSFVSSSLLSEHHVHGSVRGWVLGCWGVFRPPQGQFVRGPTSVSKLNPDNVYSIQSDVATEVWEREGYVPKLDCKGSGSQLIQLPPSSRKMLEVSRRSPENKSYY